MHWIISFIVLHKNGTSLFITIMLSIFMLNSGAVYQESISRILTISIFAPVQIIVSQTRQIRDVYSENNELKKQVAELILENSTYQSQNKIANDLAKILELKRRSFYVQIESIEEVPVSKPLIDLYCSLPKGDRQTQLLGMATQAGMERFTALECDRSVVISRPSMGVVVAGSHRRCASWGLPNNQHSYSATHDSSGCVRCWWSDGNSGVPCRD